MSLQVHRVSSIPPRAEVFLALPAPRERLPQASEFRTTWLASSLAALKARDLFDAYLRELPARYHETILGAVAGQWAPIDVAAAHYAACDRLGLSHEVLRAIGSDVTQRVHGTILSTFVKLAKQSGVTPWTVLAQLNRLWERIWVGGGVCVYSTGPKDAIVEIAGWPIANTQYLSSTMPYVIESIVSMFCRRAHCALLPVLVTPDSMAVRVSWV